MLKDDRDKFIRNLFSKIAPYIDFLTDAFSFGFSHFWRRRLIFKSGIRKGDRVLDVCTGTGELAFSIAKKFGPDCSVTGIDFCEDMIGIAMKKLKKYRQKVALSISDAKNLQFSDNTFDVVTVAFGMRNIPDTISALEEIKRVLKPKGKFLCLELTRPRNKWFLPIYKGYIFKVMPFIARVVSKTVTPFSYLPRSIDSFYPPEEFKNIIERCGFANVTMQSMTMGIATLYGAVKCG